MKKLLFILLLLNPLFILTQNVMISNTNNPNEPSIMVHPNDTNILVAGSNLNFIYTSDDAGLTWTKQNMTSTYGVWGDPVIDVDQNGNFYYFHLSNPNSGNWIDRIVCQKSTNNGATWSDGTFTGLNGTKAQDKEWSVIDPHDNTIYLTWTQFDDYGSSNPLDSSVILFSKSTDGGDSWTNPLRINRLAGDCVDDDSTVEGATPCLGPNGELYVAWSNPTGIVFNRSFDKGDTWLTNEIFVSNQPGGWNYDIPGINRSNGLPIIKCDTSGGPFHGTIYVNWSDQRNGIDNTDIWLAKSSDGGNTWSNPIKVNDDATISHQFSTWMDVDPYTGNLFFVFYDRRNYSDNNTDVYLAYSTNGGQSFVNTKISETPFIPNGNIFFGDYTNIIARDNFVRPVWTRLHNGELSIWTDFKSYQFLNETDTTNPTSIHTITDEKSIQAYPIPANDIIYVSYKIHEESLLNISIVDINGKLIKALSNKTVNYGKHIEQFSIKDFGLSTGQYFIHININNKLYKKQVLVIE